MARMLESVLEGPDHLMTKKKIRRKMDPKDDSRLSWRPAPMIACGPVLTHSYRIVAIHLCTDNIATCQTNREKETCGLESD